MNEKEIQRDHVDKTLRYLLALANEYGLVVTIEQKSLRPFAMGNYVSVSSVREKRS